MEDGLLVGDYIGKRAALLFYFLAFNEQQFGEHRNIEVRTHCRRKDQVHDCIGSDRDRVPHRKVTRTEIRVEYDQLVRVLLSVII